MKLKKLLSFVCILAMLATMIVPVEIGATTAPTFTVGNASVKQAAGTTSVSVPIEFNGSVAVDTLTIAVTYDESLTCTAYEEGTALEGLTKPGLNKNPIKIPFSADEFVDVVSGTYATLTFTVPTDTVKDFPISVSVEEAYGESGNIKNTFATVAGKISVELEPLGTFTVGNPTTGKKDGTATIAVPIAFSGSAAVDTLTIAVTYDASLTCTDYEEGTALEGLTKPGLNKNPIKIPFSADEFVDVVSGTYATLTFTVPTDTVKDFPISVSVEEAYGESGNIKAYFKTVDGKISVVPETVIGPTWPAEKDVVAPITYGQKLSEAFTLPTGTVNIDGDDYTGTFVLVNDPETIPNAGTFEAKVKFVIDNKPEYGDKAGRDNFEAPDYYRVTVNKKPLTVTVKDETIKYGDAIPNFEATITGLVNGDKDADIVLDYDCVADSSASLPDVGTYDINVEAENDNYNITTVPGTLTIEKADNATITDDPIVLNFNAGDYADAVALETAIALPVEVNVLVGTISGTVNAVWSAADKDWNPKGETYKYTATLSSDNIDVSKLPAYTATVTVAPVHATIEGAAVSKAISKYEAENATVETLGIPATVSIKIGDNEPVDGITAVWEEDIASKVIEKAAEVEGEAVVTVTVKLDVEATLGDTYKYLTADNTPVVSISISTKKPATISGDFDIADTVYGTAADITNTLAWAGDDGLDSGDDADFVIEYTDSKGNVSDTMPTLVGTYSAKAKLSDENYFAETAPVEFNITAKPVVYVVSDDTMVYGGAEPTYAGALKDGYTLGYEGDDLGITYEVKTELDEAVADVTKANAGTYRIYAKASNTNYEVSVVHGTLTINKKSIVDMTPVIDGDVKAGVELVADMGIADTFAYTWKIGDDVVSTERTYTVKIADSNKTITLTADATGAANYEDVSAVANATVAKYEIKGTLVAAVEGDAVPTAVITTDVSGIEGYDVMALTYAWAKNGTPIDGATGTTYTITENEHRDDVITVTVTPSADFTGTITSNGIVVGYRTLTGSLVLNADIPAEGDAKGLVITAVPEAPAEGYDIVWIVDGVATAVTGATYTISEADYGKAITAKLVGKGDYKGEITTVDVYDVPAIAPSDVVITTNVTKNSIDVEVTANANGAAITEYALTLKDGEGNVVEEATATIAEGKGTYTFKDLESKTEYTITVVAKNAAGETEETATATTKAAGTTAAPVTGGATTPTKPSTPPATETPSTGETETPSTGETETPSTGETETPATPETTITVPEADVVVESKTETATVPAADLADASVVAATVTTESGAKVDVTVDVADKAVDSLTVSADKANAEVTGKAADGIVGDAIEVKVDAKSGDTAVAVEATIAIDVEAQAYAYAVDELGNTVRLESAYDAETGKLLVAGVADGTVVAVSTTAPVDFADTADRWSDKEVKRAVDLGIVNGRSADAYAPAELLTRSETNKLKKNLAEVLKLELTVNADVKIDTDPSHWAYEADLWAAQTGITSGTGKTEDGTVVISGGDNVVRQDYLTLLARMIKLAIGDVTIEGTGVEFADAEHVADYAADSINLLSSIGILKGSEGADGVYANPKANITREEAAALSNRAYEFVKVLKTAK